jgi:hypothetical protein
MAKNVGDITNHTANLITDDFEGLTSFAASVHETRLKLKNQLI